MWEVLLSDYNSWSIWNNNLTWYSDWFRNQTSSILLWEWIKFELWNLLNEIKDHFLEEFIKELELFWELRDFSSVLKKSKNFYSTNKNWYNIFEVCIQNWLFDVSKDLLKIFKKYENISKMISDILKRNDLDKLTSDDRKKLFSEEILSELPLNIYIKLWKLWSPYYVSHITRQWFRDHFWMIYHTWWLNEFSSWFTDILNWWWKLYHPNHIFWLELSKEKVRKFLEEKWFLNEDDWEYVNWNENKLHSMPDWITMKENVRRNIEMFLQRSLASAPKYPDKTAIHFAVEEVLDHYYWAEWCNEVFFIFPSDLIAWNYSFYFNWWTRSFKEPQSEQKWNDLFVWNNLDGISLDSWIVFLPEDTLVDPNTWSRYASNEIETDDWKKILSRIENNELKEKVLNWYYKVKNKIIIFLKENNKIKDWYDKREHEKDFIISLLKDFQDEIWEILWIYTFINNLIWQVINFTDYYNEWEEVKKVNEYIEELNIWYKLADNPIRSKDFWERYFSKNPDKKPKHIVYYSWDPTKSVGFFLRENWIESLSNSEHEDLLWFDENYVKDIWNDSRSNFWYTQLWWYINEILDERYWE